MGNGLELNISHVSSSVVSNMTLLTLIEFVLRGPTYLPSSQGDRYYLTFQKE